MTRTRVAALALVAMLAGCGEDDTGRLQGYVEGEYVHVAAPFAGTLVALEARRGDAVRPGTPLFALESESEQAARREAEQRLRRAEAQLADLRKGLRESELREVRAQLAQAEAAADVSARELARQSELVERGFVSRQRADEARGAHERDRARVAELRARLATARAGTRPDAIRAAEAEVAAAREALAQADWRVRQKRVASTVAGTVTDTMFSEGEWVPSGAPVVALLPPGNVKLRFFVPEPRLAAVRVGQRVAVACDGCPRGLGADVTFVSPQAEFTPPVIYSRENRARLVFLVEARPEAGATPMHPGLPVEVILP